MNSISHPSTTQKNFFEKDTYHNEINPLRRPRRERIQCNQQRQRPELQADRREDAAVAHLAHIRRDDHRRDPDERRGDAQEVRLRGGEAQVPER